MTTKCLSCGHLRHDFELNCPKCGSFYSTMENEFVTSPEEKKKPALELVKKIKVHLEHPKHRVFAIGVVIFLVIAVLFL